ncbi:MAG: arginine deiminase-related protein [Saprospiraceae bacterium]
MERQSTNTVLMIRPENFGYNTQTAADNTFQTKPKKEDIEKIKERATVEFDNAVDALRAIGIRVIVVNDTSHPEKPDAVFPNNWFSTHSEGTVLTYPMYSPVRRLEVRQDIIEMLGETFDITRDYTMTHYTEDQLYLEGTGSLVLDRINKVAYACLSPRTSVELLDKWAVIMDYKMVHFHAADKNGVPIYHTNVLMCIATDFVVICMDAIVSEDDRNVLKRWFDHTDKTLIEISFEQMEQFAGNMLEVVDPSGQLHLICSQTAYLALHGPQRDKISSFLNIVPLDLDTIEKIGGGSARCMIAEIFLKKKKS